MSTQREYIDNNISLAWEEYMRADEISNYAENLLGTAEYYRDHHERLVEENKMLRELVKKAYTEGLDDGFTEGRGWGLPDYCSDLIDQYWDESNVKQLLDEQDQNND